MRSLDSHAGAATPVGNSRADKKSVNTKTNSSLNFLIGLSAVLMIAFVIIELQVPEVDRQIIYNKTFDIEPETTMDIFVVEKSTPKVVIKKTPPIKKVNKLKPPIILDNNDPIIEPVDDPTPEPKVDTEPTKADTPVARSDNEATTSKMENTNLKHNLLTVSAVPLYPGCNARLDNEERIECLNEKMARFVQRHFDTGLASEVSGKDIVSITVVFTIGIDGNPKDIQVRAPNKELEKEAYRVISKLPKMTPGKFGEVDVNTTYALPIKFRVQR